MATAKPATRKPRLPWAKIVLALAVIGGGIFWYFGEAIAGYAAAGTGYGAKNACSCRYVAGRDLDSCYADFVPGMAAIWLSEDEAEQSVTASVPLIDSATATYREGQGCTLEAWEN